MTPFLAVYGILSVFWQDSLRFLPDGTVMSEDKLLTPPQVAQHLQVNERTVTQWLRRGHLRGFKIGKEWRVCVLPVTTRRVVKPTKTALNCRKWTIL
jgi:excisionase family DNA binding protein